MEELKQATIDELQSLIKHIYGNLPSTGEITEENQNRLTEIEQLINDKLSIYSDNINNINMTLEKIKNAKSILDGKSRQLNQQLDSIKNELKEQISESVNTNQYSVYYLKSESIEVNPLAKLEDIKKKYPKLVKTEYKLDKKKVKEHLKLTGILPEGIYKDENESIVLRHKITEVI